MKNLRVGCSFFVFFWVSQVTWSQDSSQKSKISCQHAEGACSSLPMAKDFVDSCKEGEAALNSARSIEGGAGQVSHGASGSVEAARKEVSKTKAWDSHQELVKSENQNVIGSAGFKLCKDSANSAKEYFAYLKGDEKHKSALDQYKADCLQPACSACVLSLEQAAREGTQQAEALLSFCESSESYTGTIGSAMERAKTATRMIAAPTPKPESREVLLQGEQFSGQVPAAAKTPNAVK